MQEVKDMETEALWSHFQQNYFNLFMIEMQINLLNTYWAQKIAMRLQYNYYNLGNGKKY